jgi:acetyl-CoA carboxylase biotin carboxyl carrier protein
MSDVTEPRDQTPNGAGGATTARDPGAAQAPVPDPAVDAAPPVPTDPGDVALLALIDRLAGVLERSDLTELEVQVGATGLVLRKPEAVAAPPAPVAAPAGSVPGTPGGAPAPGDGPSAGSAAPARPSVKAPLTGIWYGSPSPGSAPYVVVGGEVAAGQVVGLIEAMKLFNEIKSDLSGRVARIHAENGKLVKARQPLIDVEPL